MKKMAIVGIRLRRRSDAVPVGQLKYILWYEIRAAPVESL